MAGLRGSESKHIPTHDWTLGIMQKQGPRRSPGQEKPRVPATCCCQDACD